MELTVEITLIIVFWNLFMTILLKYLTLKNSAIFNDDTFRNFFSPALLKEEIIQTFQSELFALNKDEPTCEFRKKYYERKMQEELVSVDSYEKNKKVKKKTI